MVNVIEFFGLRVKPMITRGKYVFCPLKNQKITDNIYAMRDKDCNAFIYQKDGDTIAFDCGYKNSQNVVNALCQLGLRPEEVTHLFLTHLDLDHAGGADKRSDQLYPKAAVYLGRIEEGYLSQKLFRKKFLGIGLKTAVELASGCRLLDDGQIVMVGSIKVQAILIPGHTLGHLCYLVDDKYLFAGDTLLLVNGLGYAFYAMWNVNTKLLQKSLLKLCEFKDIEMIMTSHSGYTVDLGAAFSHIDTSPNWKEKGYKINDNAPLDLYDR